MGHIYFIMGVSGSGKGTLVKNLKNLNTENIHIPLSYKTRNIREGEVNGVDANFISREDFFAQIRAGEFLEYALVHDLDYYGTKFRDVIDEGIDKGKIVIKEIDINGLEDLRINKPQLDEKYTTIFLNIPTNILKERIMARGAFMSDEELEKRIKSSTIEEEKSLELCNFMIDATKKEEEVLLEFLEITKKVGKPI